MELEILHNDLANKMLSVSEPTVELGENRYLNHYIYEVFSGSDLAGHIFMTRYNYRQAREDRVLTKWLCQRDSYTEHNAETLLEPTSDSANLPTHIAELIDSETGFLVILDEVTFNPRYRRKNLEKEAIRNICDQLRDMCDLIAVPDFAPMARYINGINTSPIDYWEGCGFSWQDSGARQVMVRSGKPPEANQLTSTNKE